MEIIDCGDYSKREKSVIRYYFHCLNCGCKFLAQPDEVEEDCLWADDMKITLGAAMYCPNCGKIVKQSGSLKA